MDPEGKNFGRGPRELTGAIDLISRYKLLPHHEFFCKRSIPLSIADTHYLHNVVGDTEIRKGEGMQLDQLIQDTSHSRQTSARIQPLDLDILHEAFQLRETAPIDLPATKGSLQSLGIPKVSPEIRKGSIKSTKIRTERRIKNIRSTSIVTEIEVKTRIGRERKIKVGSMILWGIIQRNTKRRGGSMMETKTLMMFTVRRKVSTKAQELMRLAPLKLQAERADAVCFSIFLSFRCSVDNLQVWAYCCHFLLGKMLMPPKK